LTSTSSVESRRENAGRAPRLNAQIIGPPVAPENAVILKGDNVATSHKKSIPPKNRGKVGSDPQAARKVGGKGDFGAPENDPIERDYASQETKHADPGASPQRIPDRGDRVSGVGSNVGGPGAGSGGDIDTDIVGVGFNGDGIAESGPDEDDTDEKQEE
jgi:hypothetical protein